MLHTFVRISNKKELHLYVLCANRGYDRLAVFLIVRGITNRLIKSNQQHDFTIRLDGNLKSDTRNIMTYYIGDLHGYVICYFAFTKMVFFYTEQAVVYLLLLPQRRFVL